MEEGIPQPYCGGAGFFEENRPTRAKNSTTFRQDFPPPWDMVKDVEDHHHVLAGTGYLTHIGSIHEPKLCVGNVISIQGQINHLGHQVDPHIAFRLQTGEQNGTVSRAATHFKDIEALALQPEPAEYGELNSPLDKTAQGAIHRLEFGIAQPRHFFPPILLLDHLDLADRIPMQPALFALKAALFDRLPVALAEPSVVSRLAVVPGRSWP
jgi:hypothetical protein